MLNLPGVFEAKTIINLSDCSPVLYRNALRVDLMSSLIFSELLFLKKASASSTNRIKPFREVVAQSKTWIKDLRFWYLSHTWLIVKISKIFPKYFQDLYKLRFFKNCYVCRCFHKFSKLNYSQISILRYCWVSRKCIVKSRYNVKLRHDN